MQIPDSHVENALDILKSMDCARARAAYEYAEKQLKVVLARRARESNAKTVGEREAEALCSEEYAEALTNYHLLGEAYYEAKDRRDAASAVISAWQTMNANQRQMERVR